MTDDLPFYSNYSTAYPDTTVYNLHNFTERNYSGNLGNPQPNYFVNYKSSELGFKLYDLPYGNQFVSPNQIEYFKTKGPFASLSGFAGSKELQMFKLLFTHTTKSNLNIAVKFNRFNTVGFYKKQVSYTNNFYTTLNYHTKKNRFGFNSYFLLNKVKHQENGGIKYDTIIRDNPMISKDLLAINLSNAKRENRINDFVFNPWFRLNRNDSGNVSHYIDYKFNYTGSYYWYLDYGVYSDGFYSTMYLDTTKTSDSTHLRQYINRANYTFKLNKIGISAQVGFSHEYNQIYQNVDSIIIHQQLHAGLFYNKLFINKDSSTINRHRYFNSQVTYNSIVSGANANDSKLEWTNTFKFRVDENGFVTKKTTSIFLNVMSESRHPDFIYNYLYANNFRWTNNFKPVNLFQLAAGAAHQLSGISGSVLWQNTANYLYMDSTALPKQSNVIISNWAYAINFNKVLFKHLGIGINVTYQTTNKAALMRVTPLYARGTLFYTGNLFKNNLQLQIGAQCEYYQSFKSLAYMPSYNMYYLQNRHSAGEYPFVDVFLNARIKPVQFFLKVENVLYGATGTNYDFVKGYFQPDRAFRFGLTWLFFD